MNQGPDTATWTPVNRPWLRNHCPDTRTTPALVTSPVTLPKHDRLFRRTRSGPLPVGLEGGRSAGRTVPCFGLPQPIERSHVPCRGHPRRDADTTAGHEDSVVPGS